jgi:hypothetical protein
VLSGAAKLKYCFTLPMDDLEEAVALDVGRLTGSSQWRGHRAR